MFRYASSVSGNPAQVIKMPGVSGKEMSFRNIIVCLFVSKDFQIFLWSSDEVRVSAFQNSPECV